MSKFVTTFKNANETNYTLAPFNKFGIKFDKINKVATVTVTSMNPKAPKGKRVQTFETVSFKTVKDAKNYCWRNEHTPAMDLIEGATLIMSY